MRLIDTIKKSFDDTISLGDLRKHGRYVRLDAEKLTHVFSNPVVTDQSDCIETSDPNIRLILFRVPRAEAMVYSLKDGCGINHRVVMFESLEENGKPITISRAECGYCSDWSGFVLQHLRRAALVVVFY